MAKVLNTTARMLIVGGVPLVPTVPTEVKDAALSHKRVQTLVARGDLKIEAGSGAAAAPEAKAPPKGDAKAPPKAPPAA